MITKFFIIKLNYIKTLIVYKRNIFSNERRSISFNSPEKLLKCYKIFVFALFFLPLQILSQIEKDSSVFSITNYSMKFFNNSIDKQLNTYIFNEQLRHFISGTNYFLGINENFNSTIISSVEKNIKDEQYLRMLSHYNFSENILGGIYLTNNLYSDNRQVAINKTSALNASLFLKYIPAKNFEIVPFGGLSSNNQIGEKDNGFVYGSEASMNNLNLGDFDVSSFFRFQNEDISPRKNTFRYFGIDLNSNFEEDFYNTISSYIASQRKDFYFTADESTAEEYGIVNNIQSRIETNYLLQDRIKFIPQNSPLSFDIQGRIFWRNIERNTRYISLKNISSSSFDSKIQEFRLDFISAAEYKLKNLNISLKFSFTEREEKHQPRKIEGLNEIVLSQREKTESLKNNISQLANISLNTIYNLSDKERITFSFYHRKLKYDTPSEENYDDRDELLSIGRILFEKQFNSFLKAFVNLEGNLNRIVYIFAERSSNNNIQRIIKLSSGGVITSKKFTSSNSAEVSANYTVFDYEKLNPNYKSYSFRQFIMRDSTSIILSKNFSLFITAYAKLSEQGDFQWSSFSSRPQRYLSEQYAEPKIFFNYFNFSIGTGIRYFSLVTFSFKSAKEKNKLSEYKSIGPVLEVNYDTTKDFSFKLYGWYEFIQTENYNRREITNFNLKLLYNFK